MPRRMGLVVMLATLVMPLGSASAQTDRPASSPWQPFVAFSAEQQRTCLVDVGQRFPEASLTNLAGGETTVGNFPEDQLTLIAFWNERTVGGMQLRNTIHRRVGETQAKVVAIYVGEDRQAAEQILANDPDRSATYLIDDGTLWQQVANGQPPRLFLLRGNDVVWLDIEFSLDARRELLNAIRFHAER